MFAGGRGRVTGGDDADFADFGRGILDEATILWFPTVTVEPDKPAAAVAGGAYEELLNTAGDTKVTAGG